MCVVCISIGVYVTSKIGLGISNKIDKNKIELNLKKWEEEEKKRLQKSRNYKAL